MDKARKAALYSALLFPGWGQIYLKHYKRGLIFILSVLVGTMSLAVTIIVSGAAIVKAAPFKKGAVQFSDVINVCVKSIEAIGLKSLFLMILLLLLLWILSIVDAYLLGKKIASSTIAADPQSPSDPV